MSESSPPSDEKSGMRVSPALLTAIVASVLGAGGAGTLAYNSTNLSNEVSGMHVEIRTLSESMKDVRSDIKEIQRALPKDGEAERTMRAIVREMVKPDALK